MIFTVQEFNITFKGCTVDEIKLKSRAKINLTLDVLGKREDGYHDVCMVMQTVALYDGVYIKRIKKPVIKLKSNISWLACDERNIAYRAAQLMIEEFGIEGGIFIELDKRIPIAAGLAGGSGNCAATLMGINKICGLGLSTEKLMELGLRLGSDVPYCIMGGTAVAQGLGERLTPAAPCPDMSILLAKPGFGVSSAEAYKYLELDKINVHPDTDGMLKCIENSDVSGIAAKLCNVLETSVIPRYPAVEDIKKAMLESGALGALMSGSGPTVFGIFESRRHAMNAADAIKRSMGIKQVFVTSTCYI